MKRPFCTTRMWPVRAQLAFAFPSSLAFDWFPDVAFKSMCSPRRSPRGGGGERESDEYNSLHIAVGRVRNGLHLSPEELGHGLGTRDIKGVVAFRYEVVVCDCMFSL